MTGYANKIKELAWDSTSRFLATGGREVVAVWDVSGKGPRGTRPKELHRHTKKVTLLAWQSRGMSLISGSADGTVALWDPERSRIPFCMKLLLAKQLAPQPGAQETVLW
jgi:WD40 repeat protein